MKKICLFLGFLIFAVVIISAQENYDYLKITLVDGKQCLNIRVKALSLGTNFLENNPVRTVTFQKFMDSEPAITQPEGFFLCEELDDWRKKTDRQYPLTLAEQRAAQQAARLAEGAAVCLFGDSLKDLRRDQFLMLWVSLSRKAVKNSRRDLQENSVKESWFIAQTGELVWNLMPKSWTVEDTRAFALYRPNDLAVTLLVDPGANIMTKIILFPELKYRQKFSYDLVDKSSKDLKDYAIYK
ncbi:MAG: hypothetical protein HY931_00900 [Candidatus Falkowbacteria bacterium]|nr:MAG: hypothetical protein HY931_00900 [Candidatus Falkowbacteria bacterium]